MDVFSTELEKEYSAIGVKHRGTTVKPVPHQTGRTTKKIDKTLNALAPGKRVSRYGNVYYEYRKNRSDMKGTKL